MKIQKLPEETITKLKSGVIITDATQCVLELVYNALDAEATSIVIQIDLKNYKIQVTDNGIGISFNDLHYVGERYMTSKFNSFQKNENNFHAYGFKGQALSSMLDVCKSMTIKTRSKDSNLTIIKTFQGNKTQPIKKKKMRENKTGTSVTIEDFLYNMPVRRIRVDEVFDLDEMKSHLKFLAIVHHNVSFTLRNENKCLILLQTQKSFNVLNAIEQFYGASFCKSLKYVNYIENNYKIIGYISMEFQNLNTIQLFYVNKRIIAKGMIHKIINDLVIKYFERITALSESPIKQGLVLKHLQQSCASFILEIQCSISSYELFTNSRQCTVEFKKWKEVLKCVHKAIKKAVYFNEVSSSNSTTFFKKKESNEKHRKHKKSAISALINAVKGVPVKRNTNTVNKSSDYNKKLRREDEKEINLSLCRSNNEKKKYELQNFLLKSNVISFYKRFNNFLQDSLESPIPKKRIKSCTDSNKNKNFEVNFLESFWLWLKSNEEAKNFLKPLLLNNNSDSNLKVQQKSVTCFPTSSILEKAICRSNYIYNNDKNVKLVSNFKEINASKLENISKNVKFIQKKKINISPEKELTVKIPSKKALENSDIFSKENSSKIYDYFQKNEIKRSKSLQLFKTPNSRQAFISATPAVSDVVFNNFINLRNLSIELDQQLLPEPKLLFRENKISTTILNTWKSHYGNSLLLNELPVELSWQSKTFNVNEDLNKINTPENFDSPKKFSQCSEKTFALDKISVVSGSLSKAHVKNAKIQVNLEKKIDLKKMNAAVQTNITVNKNTFIWTTSPKRECNFNVSNQLIFENEADYTHVNFNPKTFITENKISDKSQNFQSQEGVSTNFLNSSDILKNIIETTNILDTENQNLTISMNSIPKDKLSNSSDFIYSTQNFNPVLKEKNKVLPESLAYEENVEENLTKILPIDNCNCTDISNISNTSAAQLLPTLPVQKLSLETLNLNQADFDVSARYNFVPKGLSPNIISRAEPKTLQVINLSPHGKDQIKSTIESSKNDILAAIKWQDDLTGLSTKPNLPNGFFEEMQRKTEETMNLWEKEVLSASLPYSAIKVQNLLRSFTLNKDLLSQVEVIGQLDQKFIVAKMIILGSKEMELVLLFDQHAVDERIKLEKLMKDYISADGELISSRLHPKLECRFSESVVQTITDLKNKLLKFGLSWKLVNETTILVETVPTFLYLKHSGDKNKKYTSIICDIQALINNILEELSDTRGVISKIPKKFYKALCLEACHKAIKFNRALTKEKMTSMIKELTMCTLPFQCAHGRPSVTPIIDLKEFKLTADDEAKYVNIKKIKKFINLQNFASNFEEAINFD